MLDHYIRQAAHWWMSTWLSHFMNGWWQYPIAESLHFIGLSLGGMIGQFLALEHPELFQSLTLCDTMSRVPAEAKSTWDERIHTAQSQGLEPLVEPTVARWFTPPFREQHPEVLNKVRAMIRSTPVAGYAGCCHAIAALNFTDRLKAINVPTLIVSGDEDILTGVNEAELMHHHLAGSQMRVIPKAGHYSPWEQSESARILLRQ